MGFQLENNTKVSPLKQKTSNDGVSFLKQEITLFGNAFSNKIKEDFYTELAVLLKAGVSLKASLELVAKSQKKQANKTVITTLSEAIVSGASLSDAMMKISQFTTYEFYAVRIGEETGTLGAVIAQLGTFFSKKNTQKRQLISALTYPVIILSTAILVVLFMLNYVVPMFQDIFKQQGVDLPPITKAIIKVSELLSAYGWVLILVCLPVFFAKPIMKKEKRVKVFFNLVTLKLPFIGHFMRTVYLSQFTQAVAFLTASKVPMVNSIRLVKQMIDFYPLQKALESVEQHILKGMSLSESLEQHALFDDKMIALVKVAEETNQTEYVFERLHIQYNTKVEQQSKMLSTLMEPVIILVVGVLVGVILVAMYLPMFKLSSVIG
jgi:type IV pilus assembly protein PilC